MMQTGEKEMAAYESDVAREEHFVPLPLGDVRIGGLLGERVETTIRENLFKLDVENDFLMPFRRKDGKCDYVGLGKLLDAAVHFAQYTADSEAIAFKEHLFREIIATQEDDGYIGSMPSGKRIFWPFDLHDESHIVSALLEDYRVFGTPACLKAAKNLLSLIMDSYRFMPKEGMILYGVITKHMMGLGLEHALLNMYDVTGDGKYLDFCLEQCGMKDLCWPIQLERRRPLHGHSYMYLNKAMAHLRLYKITGNEFHLKHPMLARDFMLYGGGTTVIGGVGMSECWTNDQNGRGNHAETCSTAYQLRFFAKLMQLTGDSAYGDVMERMIYNALLGAQSPDGRRIRYYNPFEGKRKYWERDTYCCPNNYRRIIAELPSMALYADRDGGGLVVNLYTPFQADATLNGMPVKAFMETNYPKDGDVVFKLEPERAVAGLMRFRIPRWCRHATVSVNGEPPQEVPGGQFARLERVWSKGDTVRLILSMDVRFVLGHDCQSGMAAVMRGPVVYTLNPANCGVNPDPGTLEHTFRAGDLHFTPDESLNGRESADLKHIRLSADYAKPNSDGSLDMVGDPDGSQIDCLGLLQFRLTPYPDPEGLCSYFHLSDIGRAVPDELFCRRLE
ncbi:MAG: glycoside hydrolase family 127 protein [Victivallales bacterium]|nr:glycoside hydrolase family 127 protein [Victivallales bacterium]